jgi:hypothetical protein
MKLTGAAILASRGMKILQAAPAAYPYRSAAEAGGGVRAEDQDPVRRWRSISDWYAEFAAKPHWGFLAPMVGLTAWVAEQQFAAPLFPSTSHEWLCVDLRPGYNPDLPFFSCGARGDGQFECELWAAVGSSRGRRVVPLDQARGVFAEFVALLHGIGGRAEPLYGHRSQERVP